MSFSFISANHQHTSSKDPVASSYFLKSRPAIAGSNELMGDGCLLGPLGYFYKFTKYCGEWRIVFTRTMAKELQKEVKNKKRGLS
jgi:hypothetical protein